MAFSNQLNSPSKRQYLNSLEFTSNDGIIGVNGALPAPAGTVGQILQVQRAGGVALSMTTNVPINVISLALTPGEWMVSGNVRVSFSTLGLTATGWTSINSALVPDVSLYATVGTASAALTNIGIAVPNNPLRIATAQTVYLSALSSFSTGSATVCGILTAQRIR